MAKATILIVFIVLVVGANAADKYDEYKIIDQLLRQDVFDESFDDNMKKIDDLLEERLEEGPPESPWMTDTFSILFIMHSIQDAIEDGNCLLKTYRRVKHLNNDLKHIQSYKRISAVIESLSQRYAKSCLTQRIEAYPKVVRAIDDTTVRRAREFGKFMLTWYAGKPDGADVSIDDIRKALNLREISWSFVMAVYNETRTRALNEVGSSRRFLKNISPSNAIIPKDNGRSSMPNFIAKPFKKLLCQFETKTPTQQAALQTFNKYVDEPCLLYREKTGAVLGRSLWEARHYSLEDYYNGNEAFYLALSDYNFCSAVTSKEFQKHYEAFVKLNV